MLPFLKVSPFSSLNVTIIKEIPLHISFKGEKAIDAGGVSREMFSAFFEAVYAKYFDGAGLLCPVGQSSC